MARTAGLNRALAGARASSPITWRCIDETRDGAVYLNGVKVDPFEAPMPVGFYVVTYELGSRAKKAFRTTEGHYEGAIAECVVYDAKLSEAERKGVEEYLRRKWISAVHVEGS
ncbi:MAG: hypothetical protein PVH68_20150 [Armatimonadota bacterium]